MQIITAALVFALTGAIDGATGKLEMADGGFEFMFDENSGRLIQIAYKNEVIAERPPGVEPMSFAVGPKDNTLWLEDMNLPRKLIRFDQQAPGIIEITTQFGDYELVERYKIRTDLPRLDRSARLINRCRETVKLRDFSM